MAFETTNRNVYGAREVNGLADPQEYHRRVTQNAKRTVCWKDPDLLKIIRLRMVSDPGFPWYDITYCHGMMKDGEYVKVDLPFDRLFKAKQYGSLSRQIIAYAKKDGVYARRLGILEAVSTLV
jgi:hypothetical protein